MKKVALIIIYNHQYNQNIDIIERIYEGRFSNIYHLVPFYNGEKSNVIAVYESSHYFQGYIAQGFKSYFKEDFAHYFFIADDLLLNPLINEHNFKDYLRLNANSCFIPGITSLDKAGNWPRVGEAFRWQLKQNGIEAVNQIPTYHDALKKIKKFGFEIKPISNRQIFRYPDFLFETGSPLTFKLKLLLKYFKKTLSNSNKNLPYPMVGAYSDIIVISSDVIKDFCHYCGVFAATKLFVELGLPTALLLSAKEIVVEETLELKGKALWTEGDYQELDIYNNSLGNLFSKFPANYLYIHPIKLSKWRIDF